MKQLEHKSLGILKRFAGIAAIPAICLLVMLIACSRSGTMLFTGLSTYQTFFKGIAYILLIAYGVSINMHTGRFDFSTGSIILLSGCIGAKIMDLSGGTLNVYAMALICVVSGVVLGLITGTLYVLLRLPPMIIGLGCTLIFEGVACIVVGKGKDISLKTYAQVAQFGQSIPNMLIIVALALAFMVIAFAYTKFGYDYRALQTGQKISVHTGVRESKNAISCYAISGMMFGAAGFLSVVTSNATVVSYNFGTISKMFVCFLPLFFGQFIVRFCNKHVAILVGVVAYEIMRIGFGQIATIDMNFTSAVYGVIESVVLVIFLIWMNNIHELEELTRWKRRAKSTPTQAKT